MDRGTVQSLVKIADDMAIMGTADSKTPITIRLGGGGLIKAYAMYAPINRHKLYVAPNDINDLQRNASVHKYE